MEAETTLRLNQTVIAQAVREHVQRTLNRPLPTSTTIEVVNNEAVVVIKGDVLSKGAGVGAKLSTRTPAGREYLDSLVMAQFMENAQVQSAEGIRHALSDQGAEVTPMQLLKSLHRLQDRNLITREGQARGTLYILAPTEQPKKAKGKSKGKTTKKRNSRKK